MSAPAVAFEAKEKVLPKAIVGVIHLKSGGQRTFTDYIRYFAARAYYQLRGECLLAVCSAIGDTHLVGEDARKGIIKDAIAKAA